MVHISRIDLNLFTVLDAIYSEGSVTRAGVKLNLTQSTISHALARLRELFDDPLFVRQGQGMVPTPLTRSVIEPVRRALRGFEATLNGTGQFDAGTAQRRFTIGLRDTLETTVLPPLMQHVAQAAPHIDIATVRASRRTLEAALAAGALDAAVDVLLPLSEHVRRRRVAGERMVVLARHNHPVLDQGLDLETYLRQQHILVTSRRRGIGFEDQELSRLGLHRRVRLRCQHYFAACWVVSRSDLLLTMSERHARIVNGQFGNAILPMPLDTPSQDFYLYWHEGVDTDPANRWLRERLLAAFLEQAPDTAARPATTVSPA